MGLEGQITLKVLAAMDFGKYLMVQYAVENVMSGKTTDEIKQISNKLYKVQALLTSGSLYAALDEMQKVTPDSLVTQDIINKYVLQIRKYLSV